VNSFFSIFYLFYFYLLLFTIVFLGVVKIGGPWTWSIFWWTQSMDQGSMFCTLPRKGAHTSKPNSRERGNSSLKTEMRVFLLLVFFGCTLEDTLAVKKSGVSSSTPKVRPEPLIYTCKQVDKHQWPFYMGFPFALLYYFSQPKLVHFRKKIVNSNGFKERKVHVNDCVISTKFSENYWWQDHVWWNRYWDWDWKIFIAVMFEKLFIIALERLWK